MDTHLLGIHFPFTAAASLDFLLADGDEAHQYLSLLTCKMGIWYISICYCTTTNIPEIQGYKTITMLFTHNSLSWQFGLGSALLNWACSLSAISPGIAGPRSPRGCLTPQQVRQVSPCSSSQVCSMIVEAARPLDTELQIWPSTTSALPYWHRKSHRLHLSQANWLWPGNSVDETFPG